MEWQALMSCVFLIFGAAVVWAYVRGAFSFSPAAALAPCPPPDDCSALKKRIESLEEEIFLLQNSLAMADGRIKALELDLDLALAAKDAALANLEECTKKNTMLDAMLRAARREIDALRAELEACKASIAPQLPQNEACGLRRRSGLLS
jgi:septal ring factor EnvC (AmiA/AmiB activator)